MKKYFIGSGFFTDAKWTDENNNKCDIPLSTDDIIIDKRTIEIKFYFKNKLSQFFYNVRIAFKARTFIYWNNITYKTITIDTDGKVIIGCALKSSMITYQAGTLTINLPTSDNKYK